MNLFDWLVNRKKAERKALVMGFSNFENEDLEIPGIRRSAFAIKNVLKEHYDKTPNFDVTLMVESSKGALPYKDEKDLRHQIHTFLRSGRKIDTGILYLIGHGSAPEEKQKDKLRSWEKPFPPSFVFPGVRGSGRDIFIPMAELAQEVNKTSFGNLIVVIDCCYAGNFISKMQEPLRPGVSILTSSNNMEYAHGDYFPYSETYTLFSRFMKSALTWKAADNLTGVTTLASVYDFLCQNLGGKQHPVFRCNATSFLPLRQNKPSYTIEQMQLIHDCFFRSGDMKYRLTPPVKYRLHEAIAGLLEVHLIREAPVKAESKRKKKSYILTSRGRRLWDMMELG